jgi:DNA-binding MarR family transcriptional regulator
MATTPKPHSRLLSAAKRYEREKGAVLRLQALTILRLQAQLALGLTDSEGMKKGRSGVASNDESAVEGGPRTCAEMRARWREARVFQARAQQVLALERLQFTEWLLLETLAELSEGGSDGVHQVEIAERSGLSRMVVSYWMICMDEYELVSRGQGADARSWGVLLTSAGEKTLRRCNERLEQAGLSG